MSLVWADHPGPKLIPGLAINIGGALIAAGLIHHYSPTSTKVAEQSINVPLQAAQIAEIQKLNELLAGKNEFELQELFDFNNLIYFNLLGATISLTRITDGSRKKRVEEFFQNGDGKVNLKYTSTTQTGALVPRRGKQCFVNTSRKYSDMQNTLARFAASTQLPSTVRNEIKTLSDAAENNLMLLLDVINDNLPDNKEKIINFDIPSSPYAHVVENDYNKRTKQLSPTAENILSKIRAMLQIK